MELDLEIHRSTRETSSMNPIHQKGHPPLISLGEELLMNLRGEDMRCEISGLTGIVSPVDSEISEMELQGRSPHNIPMY